MVICDLGNSENAYLFVDCDLISASNPRATRVDWSLKGLGHVGKRDLIVYFVRTEQMWVYSRSNCDQTPRWATRSFCLNTHPDVYPIFYLKQHGDHLILNHHQREREGRGRGRKRRRERERDREREKQLLVRFRAIRPLPSLGSRSQYETDQGERVPTLENKCAREFVTGNS